MFAHLSQLRLVCMFSEREPRLRGAPCVAFICDPKVQGPLAPLFRWMLAASCASVLEWDEAEYLILIDAAIWPTLTPWGQERLIYHELRHLRALENEYGVPRLNPEGRPMLTLVPHDYEFFEDEVSTYGVETCNLQDALPALADGLQVDRSRALGPGPEGVKG